MPIPVHPAIWDPLIHGNAFRKSENLFDSIRARAHHIARHHLTMLRSERLAAHELSFRTKCSIPMDNWSSDYESDTTVGLQNIAFRVLSVLGIGLWLHCKGRRRRRLRRAASNSQGREQVAVSSHAAQSFPKYVSGQQMVSKSSSVKRQEGTQGCDKDDSRIEGATSPWSHEAWQRLQLACERAQQQCISLEDELKRVLREREELQEALSMARGALQPCEQSTGCAAHAAPLLASLPPPRKAVDQKPSKPEAQRMSGATVNLDDATQPWLEHTTPVPSDQSSPFQQDEAASGAHSPAARSGPVLPDTLGGLRLDPVEVAAAMALRQRGFGGGLLNEASIDDVRRRLGFGGSAHSCKNAAQAPTHAMDAFTYYGD